MPKARALASAPSISRVCSHGVGAAAQQACLSPGGQRRFRRCVSPVLLPLLHTGQCCLQPTGGHPWGKGHGLCGRD
ncbi:hypothetical protein NN561_004508 [Cricetulus griseus]